MIAGGFAGRILHVDLSRQKATALPLAPHLAEQFIGGLGLSFRLAHEYITPGTDPLAPENPIVIGAGPLVGTDLPSTSRVYAVTKLPASRTIGWCGAGGVTFGCQFKTAGYDHLIIEGRADRPVYLNIADDQVDILDAERLWGKGVSETSEALWRESSGPAGILSIGPAGENRVCFSMAYIDRIATLGRGGFGAVMGAKNLKAVVVQGTKGVRVADQKAYKRLETKFLKTIQSYPHLKEWQDLGMLKAFPLVAPEIYKQIKKRRLACVSCPVGCKDAVEIPDGPHKGLVAYSSSAINLFTPLMYGFQDYREAVKLIAALDEYGMDMFEFFGVMGLAAKLGGQGTIPEAENLVLNDLDTMQDWAEKIAFRKDLGDILADGFAGLMGAFGEAAGTMAPALVKNMHPYTGPGSALPWDLFGTMELGQILDPRGPHVGSGGSPTYFAKRPLEVFPKHLKRMGVPEEAISRILPESEEASLKVGILLKYSHQWFSILGSLGVCARGQINRFYNAALCADLYESVTGIPMSLDQLRRRADRVWTLYRLLNVREGIDQSHESIPEQWVKTPGFKEYVSETPISKDGIAQMISDYYKEQGWNSGTGRPGRETLSRLGLEGLFRV